MTQFVAYVHARPETQDASGVFYVGKGTIARSRALIGSRRSAHHQNVVRKHGKDNILIGAIECSSERIAFDLERGLIKCLRRMGVELVNKTDGGEGPSGAIRTQDMRKKMSASAKARDPMTRARGYSRSNPTDEARKNMSDAGKKRPKAIREAAAEKLRGVPRPDDVKRRISESSVGKHIVSEVTREKLRAAWVIRKQRVST